MSAVGEILSEAATALNMREEALRNMAVQALASMLKKALATRDDPIWTVMRIDAEGKLLFEVDCPPRIRTDRRKFSDGGACSLEEIERRGRTIHHISIEESDRQMILMALAHLAVERPGWMSALNTLACTMDHIDPDGKAKMFEEFRRLHAPPAKQAKESNP